MKRDHLLEDLWETAPAATSTFDPASVASLPPAARRYLLHALAPGARLSTTARLRMHGEIRLGEGYHPFEAEQVLRWDRGFVWRAKARVKGLPIVGFDRWVDGEGAMRWKLLNIVPIITADGPDITRSAAGRLQIESIWLPAVLLGDGVLWEPQDDEHAAAIVRAHGEASHIELSIDEKGAPRSNRTSRWGNPDGAGFHYADFGGLVEEERTFDGITVPTRVRVGWFVGSPRFETEGEFIRVNIDHIDFK
jgi:hypothetical protein